MDRRGKISSAIRNLLSNAFKYTSPNGKVIFKMNRIEIDGYSFCSIIISDTGKGIPEELRGGFLNHLLPEKIHLCFLIR